eukprot:SAG11_NODE_35875_length_264_cov_1.200000_1_plen_44_part_01
MYVVSGLVENHTPWSKAFHVLLIRGGSGLEVLHPLLLTQVRYPY